MLTRIYVHLGVLQRALRQQIESGVTEEGFSLHIFLTNQKVLDVYLFWIDLGSPRLNFHSCVVLNVPLLSNNIRGR